MAAAYRLKDCVVIADKVYCWDEVSERFTAAKLVPDASVAVPDEARKMIVKRQFHLKEED